MSFAVKLLPAIAVIALVVYYMKKRGHPNDSE